MLGWVSLATDAATEAVYPLLPFFLTRVLGAGAISIGLIEGVAEAASSVLKVWSGRWSDRWRRRQPLALAGYAVSSIVRPFISLATAWPHVLGVRFLDRVGKGVRSAPRDAMLASYADARSRGLVYGFHRAMDHAGAIIGPLAAAAFLLAWPGRYRTLFALTVVPGAVAVYLLSRVPDVVEPAGAPAASGAAVVRRPAPAAAGPAGQALPGTFYRYLFVLVVFTLGNSTDAFLLLRLTDAAGGPELLPVLWALLHVVKMGSSVVGGALSDRVGRRRVIVLGWLVYAVVYGGFAVSASYAALVAWFLVYGLYFGLTEGVERALVADLAPAAVRGTAFGLYNAVAGVGALAASLLFGVLWEALGAATAFGVGASLALVASVLLYGLVAEPARDANG
jgi:MFS family permease